VRPEKVRIHRNRPTGIGNDMQATVRDVSFTGVATQYLVTVASGATWSVYEQNLDVEPIDLHPGDRGMDVLGARSRLRRARTRAPRSPTGPCWPTCAIAPSAAPRRIVPMSALAHAAAADRRPGRPGHEPAPARGFPICCCCPARLWLCVFFVVPLVQLFTVSLQSQFPGVPRLLLPGSEFRQLLVGPDGVRAALRTVPALCRARDLFAFCLSYPLAYAMAFKAGRWRG
jgi:hypothetical protein